MPSQPKTPPRPGTSSNNEKRHSKRGTLESYRIFYDETLVPTENLPKHVSRLRDILLDFDCTITSRFEEEITLQKTRSKSRNESNDESSGGPETHGDYKAVNWEDLFKDSCLQPAEYRDVLSIANRCRETQRDVEALLKFDADENAWDSMFRERFMAALSRVHPALSDYYPEAYAWYGCPRPESS